MAQPAATTMDLDQPVTSYARKPSITLYADQTVREAIASIRTQEPGGDILYFYVVDTSERLLGVVPVRRLLLSLPEIHIGDIMITDVVTIPGTASLLDASEALLDTRLLAIPVVDQKGRLLGAIDISLFSEEMPDVVRRHEVESAFQLIGVHVGLGRNVSPLRSFQDRFPWLLTNITGGLLCAIIIGLYESLISVITILALFIPVILALSESVSMQSMTLTLQTLPPNPRPWSLILKALKREFFAAVLLGIGCGLVVALVIVVWKHQILAAGAIGASIALAMVTACILGVLIPGAVKTFQKNPNIASGPIVLALADIATLAFFFSLAALVLG
jgi:magnesium transporter